MTGEGGRRLPARLLCQLDRRSERAAAPVTLPSRPDRPAGAAAGVAHLAPDVLCTGCGLSQWFDAVPNDMLVCTTRTGCSRPTRERHSTTPQWRAALRQVSFSPAPALPKHAHKAEPELKMSASHHGSGSSEIS